MDSHTYSVEACQEHQVTAQWSQAKVYPGENVTLAVSAQVSLNDKNTLHLLRPGRCAVSLS